jgi:Cro/C1-type HTH DNA-binding domain
MNWKLRDKRLRTLAVERDLPVSGRGIALTVGLPISTMTAMLTGRAPSAASMAALCNYFGVPVEDLFELVDAAA